MLVCTSCSTFDTALSCFRSDSFQICQHRNICQHKWPLRDLWLVNASRILSLTNITNFLVFTLDCRKEKQILSIDEERVKKWGTQWLGAEYLPLSEKIINSGQEGFESICFYFSLCALGVQQSEQWESLVDYFIMGLLSYSVLFANLNKIHNAKHLLNCN